MKKPQINVEGIKKGNIYEVPEGYFDALPSRVQARVALETNPKIGWFSLPSVRWATIATPALAAILYFVVFKSAVEPNPVDIEGLLAQVEMNDLIAYIETDDLTDDQLISGLGLESYEIEEITDDLFLEEIDVSELEYFDLFEEINMSEELL